MDALHPRLLVTRFAESFRFYEAVLPKLIGAALVQGTESGPYAHWDLDGQGVLMLFQIEFQQRARSAANMPGHRRQC